MENTTMSTTTWANCSFAILARRTAAIRRMSTALFALGMLGAGSAFAAGRTDTNTVPYRESFENLVAWGGYTNVAITNGWYSDLTTDQSVITNLLYTNAFTAACGLPLPGVTHTNVLQLNTGSATLTNSFGGGFAMVNNITYMDTMVYFVTSDQAPSTCTTNDSGIKAAVYVDTATTNLVVYHGVLQAWPSSVWAYNTNEILACGINTGAWCRLTIAFDATCVTGTLSNVEMFQVKTNGVAVKSPNAYNDNWKTLWQKGSDTVPQFSTTGTWFRSAMAPSATSKTLTAIAFQGAGYIDDLVVSPDTPAGFSTSYLLTVVNNRNGSSYFGGTNALTQVTVANGTGTNIVYTANAWFAIAALYTNGVNVTAAQNVSIYTQQLAGINANVSNNVTFAQKATGAVVANVPSQFGIGMGVSETWAATNQNAMQQGYMLNLNPTSLAPSMGIAAIDMQGTTLHVTVLLQNNGAQVSTNINGTVTLLGSSDPFNGFTPVATAVTQAFSNGLCDVPFANVGTNRFYRAEVTYP